VNEDEEEKDWVNFNMRMRPEMAEKLDDEAKKIGISRAALLNVLVAQHYGLLHTS